MAANWTDDQLLAINSKDKATVVSAAAGSGKTAVLVERTIRMLTDESQGIEADKLLAVTFTNDAANNMKDKLSTAMSKILENNPENQWVTRQQELLSLATICTIDSFCMDLVKNNINDLEVSSSFTMIDEQEHSILTQKAFMETVEDYYKNKPDTMKILLDNFAEEDDSEVINYAGKLLKFKGSLPFPEQWKRKADDRIDNGMDHILDNAQKILEDNSVRLESAYVTLTTNVDLIGRSDEYAPVINLIKSASDILSYEDYDTVINSEIFNSLRQIKFPRKPNGKTLNEVQKNVYTLIDSVKNSIKDIVKNIIDNAPPSVESLNKVIHQTKTVFDALWKFTADAEKLLWEYKLEKNKLHFSDVTKLTIRLLAKETENGFEKTDLAKSFTDEGKYKIILIDEFQDVNNLQDVIFKCVSDTDDTGILGKNVFVVGDMKQSIYRFRQSNPAIFDNTKSMAECSSYKKKCAAIYLKKNFRSRKNILDFTNYIFEKVMSEQVGEIIYDKKERLELGASYIGDDHTTDIMLIDSTAVNEEDDDNSDELNVECKAVAKKVRSMIDNKFQVSDGNELRNCREGDFCVLLRTGKLVNDYIRAFESVGIKAVGDAVKGYLGAREISLALSILRIIDNPMQDIPLVAVSLSPIFGFTPDEIAKIRLVDKFKRYYQLFLAICRDERVKEYGYQPVDIGDETITQKCMNAVSVISKLRFYASGMSLEKLIRKIYDVTDLMSVASSFENSHQKRANLRYLVKLASDYENSTGGGLSDFLRYIDNVQKSNNDFEEALTVSPNNRTVTIKTIHKSKGLEYPIVIVGDLGRNYNIPTKKDKLVLNENIGYGVTLRNNLPKCNSQTFFYSSIDDKNILEQKSEELRILYVALTRAKEKLIIPLNLKKRSRDKIKKLCLSFEKELKLLPEEVEKLTCYGEIVIASLLFHPECSKILTYVNAEGIKYLPTDKLDSVRFEELSISPSDIVRTEKIYNASVDIALLDRLYNSISFEEVNLESNTVAKLSVTEFVREIHEGEAEKQITYFPPLPDVTDEDRKATAAEKGTDTHLFMELCDFEKASGNVKAELEALVLQNKMTREQADNVDIVTVESFFDSEIYALCKVSDEVLREKQFKVRLSDMKLNDTPLDSYKDKDVLVQGIADLIVKTDKGYAIVDYKTDNVKTDEELVERHSLQLFLYKKAFELIFDEKISDCYIYSFKLRRPIRVDFENLQILHKNP